MSDAEFLHTLTSAEREQGDTADGILLLSRRLRQAEARRVA